MSLPFYPIKYIGVQVAPEFADQTEHLKQHTAAKNKEESDCFVFQAGGHCLDASRFRNALGFINHSCVSQGELDKKNMKGGANVKFERFYMHEDGRMVKLGGDNAKLRDRYRPRISIIATHEIEEGDEFLLDYGAKEGQTPTPCYCIKCAYEKKNPSKRWSDYDNR